MTRRLAQPLQVVVFALSAATMSGAASPPAAGWGPDHGPQSTDHVSSSWSRLLRGHLARYPLAEAEDVYKFVHQSVFGPAHAVPSRAEARRYLDEELAALPPGPAGEPMFDALDDDQSLARLNLRPYVSAGGDVERLLDAFVATAARVHGDAAVMRRRLAAAAAVLRALGRAETARQLDALAADRAAGDYAAGHHSAVYRDTYHPAYRVVLRGLLGGLSTGTLTRGAAK